MTDLKDRKLSPIGREWDNTLVQRPKWSLLRAVVYGFGISVALFVIQTMIGTMNLSMPTDQLTAYLAGRLGFLPLVFVIVAAIRNLSVRD